MIMTHPLSDFKYCPHCGSARFVDNNAYSRRCADCGFTFYANAAAATVAVILNEKDELLCVRRKNDPAKGTLDLPGGFVDAGEGITDGLLREVNEEVGGQVTDCEYLFSLPNTYLYSGHLVHTADAFFRCTLAANSVVEASDDAESLSWIPVCSLDPQAFGLHSIRRGIERLKTCLCSV